MRRNDGNNIDNHKDHQGGQRDEDGNDNAGKKGSVRWRVTPLHAAAVFDAPPRVLKRMIQAHPLSAALEDDRGNLPLHLAFHSGMGEVQLSMLINAYRPGIDHTNNGGKVPLQCAREGLTQCLDRYMFTVRREFDTRLNHQMAEAEGVRYRLGKQLEDAEYERERLEDETVKLNHAHADVMNRVRVEHSEEVQELMVDIDRLRDEIEMYANEQDRIRNGGGNDDDGENNNANNHNDDRDRDGGEERTMAAMKMFEENIEKKFGQLREEQIEQRLSMFMMEGGRREGVGQASMAAPGDQEQQDQDNNGLTRVNIIDSTIAALDRSKGGRGGDCADVPRSARALLSRMLCSCIAME